MKELINKKKKICVIGILIVLLFAITGILFSVLRNSNQSKKKQSTAVSRSESQKER